MATITLTPDIEAPLGEAARRQGISAEQLALKSLRALFGAPSPSDPSATPNLHDFLAGYVGVVEGSTEAWSEDSGAKFADGMIEKQRQGQV